MSLLPSAALAVVVSIAVLTAPQALCDIAPFWGHTELLEHQDGYSTQESEFGIVSSSPEALSLDIYQSETGLPLGRSSWQIDSDDAADLLLVTFTISWTHGIGVWAHVYTPGHFAQGNIDWTFYPEGDGQQTFTLDLTDAAKRDFLYIEIQNVRSGYPPGWGSMHLTMGAIPSPGAVVLLALACLGVGRRRCRSGILGCAPEPQ